MRSENLVLTGEANHLQYSCNLKEDILIQTTTWGSRQNHGTVSILNESPLNILQRP